MNNYLGWMIVVVVLCAACGDDSAAPMDTGTAAEDGGIMSDGGPPPRNDGGAGLDGGVAGAWAAPVGIPRPSFGIDEDYRMYDEVGTRNPSLDYTENAEGGFYTHYVRADGPSACSNSDNPYGTESNPRCTIPGASDDPLPEGSVVELHGTYSNPHTSPTGIWVSGTAARPVFIRGLATEPPLVTRRFDVYGSPGADAQYLIVENLEFGDEDGDLSGGPTGSFGVTNRNSETLNAHHIVLRHCDVHGNLQSGGSGIGGNAGSLIADIVFYDNVIHDNGDVDADFDQDRHGIAVGFAQQVWIVDNEMYRNSGDGIQINGSTADTHHIYVGRNISHHNKQSGFWSKDAADVIFSQNTAYEHHPGNSSGGAGLGWQPGGGGSATGPLRLWVIFNRSYDNEHGIQPGSGTQASVRVVGNALYGNAATGFNAWNGSELWLVNNTIYDNPEGIHILNGTNYLINNIVQNGVVDESGTIVELRDNLYTNGSPPVGNVGGDAFFVDGASRDFHLQPGSPAMDSGAAEALYDEFETTYGIDISVDLDGNPRPMDGDGENGAEWDIGAFEFAGGA